MNGEQEHAACREVLNQHEKMISECGRHISSVSLQLDDVNRFHQEQNLRLTAQISEFGGQMNVLRNVVASMAGTMSDLVKHDEETARLMVGWDRCLDFRKEEAEDIEALGSRLTSLEIKQAQIYTEQINILQQKADKKDLMLLATKEDIQSLTKCFETFQDEGIFLKKQDVKDFAFNKKNLIIAGLLLVILGILALWSADIAIRHYGNFTNAIEGITSFLPFGG